MGNFFINMFPKFFLNNPLISYIVNYIASDLEKTNNRIIEETDFDI